MRTRVKICGITRRQDAQFAASIGVDAIGLVFYSPSPRAVTIQQAQEIITGLPPFISIVALFVNAKSEEVAQCLNRIPIDILQFHGDETPSYCAQFSSPYMKAIRMQEGVNLSHMAKDYSLASALLLDSYQAGVPGGTGKTFDWSMITDIDKPFILAGGLSVDNVTNAIQQASPYAVDVSGGVEYDKGLKDKIKMQEFMQEVNNG